MTILNKIKENTKQHPNRIAYHHETAKTSKYSEELTWQQLSDYSDRLASYIDAHTRTKNPVLVYGHKSPLMPVCFLACVKSGRAYCPIDSSFPDSRVEAVAEAIAPELILAAESFPLMERNVLTMEEMYQMFRSERGGVNGTAAYVSQDDVFYIIFTSGSTGEPKGVQITTSCLDSFLRWAAVLGSGIPEKEHLIFLNQAPFSFDLSVMDLYLSLYTGGTLFALDKSLQNDLKALSNALERSGANIWVSTPSFVEICLADRGFHAARMPGLQRFLFCGETLSKSTVQRLHTAFPCAEVINTYGPTECTVAVTGLLITDEILQKYDVLPVGRAKPGTCITIEDEGGAKQQDGKFGEIVITGDSVGMGYWKNPLGTSRVFRCMEKDGQVVRSYLTGDIGYLSDGMLFYSGRKDLQVKLHGYRIELEDIEANLGKIEGVEKACVLVNYRNGKASSLSAYIVYGKKIVDRFQMGQQLRRQAEAFLPDYMIPKKFFFRDFLPMTDNGKVDRKKLEQGGGEL